MHIGSVSVVNGMRWGRALTEVEVPGVKDCWRREVLDEIGGPFQDAGVRRNKLGLHSMEIYCIVNTILNLIAYYEFKILF